MKEIIKKSVLSLAAVAFCLIAQAQNPTMSTTYSDAEIEQMISTFRSNHSQDCFPPNALQQKFMKDFPNAFDVEWEMFNNLYEVDFNIQHDDFEAFYDAKGNLIMYSREISRYDLPAIVKNAASNQYPKYKFEDVKKIFRGSQVFYKIEMEYGDSEVKLIVKNDGMIQKQWFDF
ncbi:MAG: hypothetical protein LBL18_05940 [Bacteroidales bacterium]|jgi:hypothetical protein|nr:hypothetical protein [Bacteroidales bacterium]